MKFSILTKDFALFLMAGLLLCRLLFAAPPTNITNEEFLKVAATNFSNLSPQTAPILAKGEVGFLPIQGLIRGQDQISVDNMWAKFEERQKAGEVTWDPAHNRWALKYQSGRSSVPLNDPIEVVRGPMGYVLVDGHHDLFLSQFLNASEIAVDVKDDLSHLSPLEFWKQMKERNLVYLQETPEQLVKHAPRMNAVKDNPNRYLASLLAVKASVKEGVNGKIEVTKFKGSSTVAWAKFNNGIPFMEFYLSEILSAAGIQYDPAWGKNVPADIVDRSAIAIRAAIDSGKYPQLAAVLTFDSQQRLKTKGAAEFEAFLNHDLGSGCVKILKSLVP